MYEYVHLYGIYEDDAYHRHIWEHGCNNLTPTRKKAGNIQRGHHHLLLQPLCTILVYIYTFYLYVPYIFAIFVTQNITFCFDTRSLFFVMMRILSIRGQFYWRALIYCLSFCSFLTVFCIYVLLILMHYLCIINTQDIFWLNFALIFCMICTSNIYDAGNVVCFLILCNVNVLCIDIMWKISK